MGETTSQSLPLVFWVAIIAFIVICVAYCIINLFRPWPERQEEKRTLEQERRRREEEAQLEERLSQAAKRDAESQPKHIPTADEILAGISSPTLTEDGQE